MNSRRKGKDKERKKTMAQCVSMQHQMQRSCLRKGNAGTIKKGYGSPPLPSWKLYENPFYEGLAAAVVAAAEAAAAAAAMAVERKDDTEAEVEGGVRREGNNARALGTTEQRAQCSGRASHPLFVPVSREHHLSSGSPRSHVPPKLSCGSPRSHLQARAPSSTSDSPASPPVKAQAAKVPTRSHQPHKSPQPTSSLSPPLKTIALMRPRARGDVARLQSSVCKSASSSQCSPLGTDAVEQLVTPSDDYHFAEPELITSPRDYLRALNRSNVSKEKPMESSTVILSLSEELKRALKRVHELERSQIFARREVDSLLKRFAEERTMQKNREQERIQAAVVSLEEELEAERKARKRLEMDNRKLSRNLAEASKAVVKVEKELEKEQKARQLMEDVCDELAKEIGDDKAELEELKREHAMAREEMEEERRTLQMTEAWREERVQIKLSEAKFELEARCVALDKLKIELEMYLNSWQIQGADASYKHQGEDLREAANKLKADSSWSMLMLEDSVSYAPPSQDGPLSSDDVSSLRLSRDNIKSRSQWVVHSNGCSRGRVKWVGNSNEVSRGDSERSGSDIDPGEESGGSLSDINDSPDVQDNAWRRRWPKSRKGPTTASRLDFEDGAFAGDENGDEENGGGSDNAGSQLGHGGQGQSGNLDDESKWNDMMKARQGVVAPGDVSDGERESRSSSSPVSNRIMYWLHMHDGMEEAAQVAARLKQNDGVAQGSARGRHDKGDVYASGVRGHTRRDRLHVKDCAEGSSFGGGSPAYCNYHCRSPEFMVQKRNWAIVPAYRSVSQGRRAPMESSSQALQERKNLIEWVKPLQGNSFQEKLLEDDGIVGSDAMSRQSRGPHLKR